MALEPLEPRSVDSRSWLAYVIMSFVLPRMLSPRRPLPDRIAVAYAWALFLESEEADKPVDEWDEDTIRSVARRLARYARRLTRAPSPEELFNEPPL